jgi:hypothetical protein
LTWLRASRKVVDPEGVAWDIYVTRVRAGGWHGLDTGIDGDFGVGGRTSILWFLTIPVLVVVELVLALVRLLLLIPATVGRAATQRGLRIEAVADWPQPQRYGWEVPASARERVLAEITDGLARGSIAEPAGVVFLGELE